MSSIIFALFAPHHSVLAGHPAVPAIPPTNATAAALSGDALLATVSDLVRKAAEGEGEGWDALGMIFRIGGVSVLVSAWICFRMTRERERDKTARRRGGGGGL